MEKSLSWPVLPLTATARTTSTATASMVTRATPPTLAWTPQLPWPCPPTGLFLLQTSTTYASEPCERTGPALPSRASGTWDRRSTKSRLRGSRSCTSSTGRGFTSRQSASWLGSRFSTSPTAPMASLPCWWITATILWKWGGMGWAKEEEPACSDWCCCLRIKWWPLHWTPVGGCVVCQPWAKKWLWWATAATRASWQPKLTRLDGPHFTSKCVTLCALSSLSAVGFISINSRPLIPAFSLSFTKCSAAPKC